jgi:hypothetical protein
LSAEWRPARSTIGRCALVGSVAAVLASLYFLAPASVLQWLLVLVLVGAFIHALLRDWRCESPCFGCDNGQWYLRRQGEREPVTLGYSHFFAPRLGVIGFIAADGGVVKIVILPDSISAGDCHSLAVALV